MLWKALNKNVNLKFKPLFSKTKRQKKTKKTKKPNNPKIWKMQFQAVTLGLLTVKATQIISFKILVLLHYQKIGSKSIYLRLRNFLNPYLHIYVM